MKALLIAVSATALIAGPARAQLPALSVAGLSAEVRAGAAAGNYAGAASELEVLPRAAWGASVSYRATGRVAVYVEYSRAAFGCESGFCAGREVDFTSDGFGGGVRYALPVAPAAGPWVSAGIVRHTLRTDAEGATDADDASGWGLSAGAGVEVPLGPRLSLAPGVRYVRHGAGDDGVAMVVGDVGLRIRM
jgi:hypothetical protein